MKVILTPKESEKIFYDSLCNAVGTGYMQGYGIELVCEDSDYDKAEKALIEQGISPCIEDIWMQILRSGGTLTFKDIEGEKENTKYIPISARKEAMIFIIVIFSLKKRKPIAFIVKNMETKKSKEAEAISMLLKA